MKNGISVVWRPILEKEPLIALPELPIRMNPWSVEIFCTEAERESGVVSLIKSAFEALHCHVTIRDDSKASLLYIDAHDGGRHHGIDAISKKHREIKKYTERVILYSNPEQVQDGTRDLIQEAFEAVGRKVELWRDPRLKVPHAYIEGILYRGPEIYQALTQIKRARQEKVVA